MRSFFVVLSLLALLVMACDDLKTCEYDTQEIEILDYLELHNLVAEKHESGSVLHH